MDDMVEGPNRGLLSYLEHNPVLRHVLHEPVDKLSGVFLGLDEIDTEQIESVPDAILWSGLVGL